MIDDLDDLVLPAFATAVYASGWIVTHTRVPASWQTEIAVALVAVGAVGVIAGTRALGVDLEGGRCRASTTDGSRCRLERDPGADLCHVHQRTHDVELHPSAVDGLVEADEAAREGDAA